MPPVVHAGPRIAGDEAVLEEVPLGLALEGIVVPMEVCGGLRLDVGSKGAHRRQGRLEKRNREHHLPYLSLRRCLPAGVCYPNASMKRILVVASDLYTTRYREPPPNAYCTHSLNLGMDCILQGNSIASVFSARPNGRWKRLLFTFSVVEIERGVAYDSKIFPG